MKKSHHSKVLTFSILLITIIILLGGFLVIKKHSTSQKNPSTGTKGQQNEGINLAPPTTQEKQQVTKNKIDSNNSQSSSSGSTTHSAEIKNLYQQSDGVVIIQTALYGTGWTKCTVNLSQGSQTITYTANTVYQNSFSTCLGFSINKSEFPSGGQWQVTLTAYADSKSYTSTEKQITVIK